MTIRQSLQVPFVDLRSALAEVRADVDRAIARVVNSGVFLNGPEIECFEAAWADYCGQDHCVACASGTDALALAARALGITRAIVQANTSPFTARGLEKGGALVTIADCLPDGRADTRAGECVVPAPLYGRPPSNDEARAALIDAAHAHGWAQRGGTQAWSFYPTKLLGALGDAGALTTSATSVAQRAREHRSVLHSRMDELQAAVLRAKLLHLESWIAARRRIAAIYWDELPDWAKPVSRPDESTHALFVVRMAPEQRAPLIAHLSAQGIGCSIHYPEPLAGDCPNAAAWCDSVLSLPCWPGLGDASIAAMCREISNFGLTT